MIYVWTIDSNGFYIETSVKHLIGLTEFDITTPVNTNATNTFYTPKWNGSEWIEGWTQEEILEWKESNKSIEEPDKMEVLVAENKKLWDSIEFLLKETGYIPIDAFTLNNNK